MLERNSMRPPRYFEKKFLKSFIQPETESKFVTFRPKAFSTKVDYVVFLPDEKLSDEELESGDLEETYKLDQVQIKVNQI